MHALRGTPSTLRSSPIFGFYVLATLVVAGIIGLITFDFIDLGMSHFGDPAHRTHDVTYGLLFTTGVVGMLAQLHRPERNVAGMLMALVPVAGLVLAAVLSGDNSVLQRNPLRYAAWVTVVAALVHPAGRGFSRSFSVSRVNPAMLALIGVAAVPLLAAASTNVRLQRSVADGHGFMGHYGFAAAFSFTVIGVGLLASLRPDGWRLPAWVGGLLPALLAFTSLLYPDASSSLNTAWAAAAIAWSIAFVAAAERTKDAQRPGPVGARSPASGSQRPADSRLGK